MGTKVINLLGGSGVGKSTTRADIFSAMKKKGLLVEEVTEYVKMWAWLKRKPKWSDQAYLFGKQSQRESVLYDKVEFIVTDSPVLLSGYYEHYHFKRSIMQPSIMNWLAYAQEQGVEYHNFFLKRNKPFDELGRFETEEEAKFVDKDLREWLSNQNIPVVDINCSDEERLSEILTHLTNKGKL